MTSPTNFISNPHLEEILEHEQPDGVIVQLGGQTALKLAEDLQRNGWNIIGTSFDSMDIAEDRGRFSDLLKDLDIPYPKFGVARDVDAALDIAKRFPYPCWCAHPMYWAVSA
ncbi:MAG: hypothetical protein IPJ82_08120 [Lewinellaceae bacterium]|nr:hypothetical protein [Lewinellaceae bacterium]